MKKRSPKGLSAFSSESGSSKKRYNLSLRDVTLIEIADVMATLWVVGVFLAFSPTRTRAFIIEWKWAFFALAIIVGIKPLWSMLEGEKKSAPREARPKTTKRRKTTKR